MLSSGVRSKTSESRQWRRCMLAPGVKGAGECFDAFLGRADMPAYIHHHDAEPAFVICPSCVGLPMYVKDVAPHWTMAKIDFTDQCSDCVGKVRQTVSKADLLNLCTSFVGWVRPVRTFS